MELKERLLFLAQKYETADFVKSDPCQFLNWYNSVPEIELASFIAALLAFGNRNQFIPKIKQILCLADQKGGIFEWIKNAYFRSDFAILSSDVNKKFYRFYSYADMLCLFEVLHRILLENKSFGEFIKNQFYLVQKQNPEFEKTPYKSICLVFANTFTSCSIVPKGSQSANKRLHLYLRWMVRTNSSVDKGIWTWYSPADLVIPLDTHVLQEAVKFGIIKPKSSASLKTALEITTALKKIWPADPCKGDFALFGLGVTE